MQPMRSCTAQSTQELISALGGPDETSRLVDADISEVMSWLDGAAIPNGYHYPLDYFARQSGTEVHPSVFGLSIDLESGEWPKEQTLKLANGRHA